jgi:hypothetical protein
MLHWYCKVPIILKKRKNVKETIIMRRMEYKGLSHQWFKSKQSLKSWLSSAAKFEFLYDHNLRQCRCFVVENPFFFSFKTPKSKLVKSHEDYLWILYEAEQESQIVDQWTMLIAWRQPLNSLMSVYF